MLLLIADRPGKRPSRGWHLSAAGMPSTPLKILASRSLRSQAALHRRLRLQWRQECWLKKHVSAGRELMAETETYCCSLQYRTVSYDLMALLHSCKHAHLRVWSRIWSSPVASLSIYQHYDKAPEILTLWHGDRSLAVRIFLGSYDTWSQK